MIESEITYCFNKEIFITNDEYAECRECEKIFNDCKTSLRCGCGTYYSDVEKVIINLRKKKIDSL